MKLGELMGEFLVGIQELAQLNKGSDDIDAHFNGARTIQDVGCLDSTVLGEGARQEFAMPGRRLAS
jgi:hypothetical protein